MLWMLLGVGLFVVLIFVLIFIVSAKKGNKFKELVKSDERFVEARFFDGATFNYLAVSDQGFIAVQTPTQQKPLIFNITDINGYEIRSNGKNVANIGSALKGGLLFGDIGAIIGGIGASNRKIKNVSVLLEVNNFTHPIITFCFLETETKEGSFIHTSKMKEIDELFSLFAYLERKHKK